MSQEQDWRNSGGVNAVIEDMKFEERLKYLSELPKWKKQELWDNMQMNTLMFSDVERIFGEED